VPGSSSRASAIVQVLAMGTQTRREWHRLTAKDKQREHKDEIGPIWTIPPFFYERGFNFML
jgi:hypothetical protein